MRSYTTYPDGELVRMLRGGDRTAFTEIYNRYWEKLFYKAGKKTDNLYDAEEIVQDIFLDLWKRRDQLEIKSELNHYLGGALKFKIINLYARKKREKQYQQYNLETQNESDPSHEEWLNYTALQEKIATLVAALPEKCRLAFELRQEGLSQKEIADKMQVSENTVETHIGRALKSIRSGIRQFFSSLFSLF